MVNPTVLKEFGRLFHGESIEHVASSLEVLRPDGSPRPAEEAPLCRALKGETLTNLEEFIRTAANDELRYRQVNASPVKNNEGKIIGSVAVIRDITERKRAEEALCESERKYRELVEYSPAGIYEVDFRTGRFTSVNDAMCIISGYSREELLAMTPFALLDQESASRFRQRMKRWLSGEKLDENVDYKVIARNGKKIDVLLNVKYTKGENGDPLGAAVIAHDVTQRKKAEKALRDSEKKALALVGKLEEADRNKNHFISVLSHELRNPLAAISAGIQILDVSKDINQTEKAKEIMKRQMNQLCKLVDDLLDLARITQNRIKLKKKTFFLTKQS